MRAYKKSTITDVNHTLFLEIVFNVFDSNNNSFTIIRIEKWYYKIVNVEFMLKTDDHCLNFFLIIVIIS